MTITMTSECPNHYPTSLSPCKTLEDYIQNLKPYVYLRHRVANIPKRRVARLGKESTSSKNFGRKKHLTRVG